MAIRIVLLSFTMLLAAACAPNTTSTNKSDGGDIVPPLTCAGTAECDPGLVCNPLTATCENNVECVDHPDCGINAICDNEVCIASSTGSPCYTDDQCPPSESCIDDFCGCDGEVFAAEPVAPNLLLVLDRSGSMGGQKWDDAKAAVNQLLQNFGTESNFGLMLYPTPGNNGCSARELQVNTGPNTQFAIQQQLETYSPAGNTPILASLQYIARTPGVMDDLSTENVIILLTDGGEGCGSKSLIAQQAASLLASTPPVKTFTIGFGNNADTSLLDEIAFAGGTTSPYSASNTQDLLEVLGQISGSVLSCSYELGPEAEDIGEVAVRVDGEDIPRDPTHVKGWDYDPTTNRITFYGLDCSTIQSGVPQAVQVLTGCAAKPN